MKKNLLFIAGLFFGIVAVAQNPEIVKYGNMITQEDLKADLSILASDAMEGRETGKRGQKMAAAFIKAHFEELGLEGPVKGDYYQPVNLYTELPGDIYLKSAANKFSNFGEAIFLGSGSSKGELSAPLVFMGNGTEADFAAIDVKDKAVAIFAEGMRLNNNPAIKLAREKGAKLILVCNTKTNEEFQELALQFKGYLSGGRLSVDKPESKDVSGMFFVSPAALEKITGTTMDKLRAAAAATGNKGVKKIKPSTIQYKVTSDLKVVKSENVLGYLEGTDKKDEVIVITSHYDHIGKLDSGEGDLINNGADDDGSGTVAVMALAKVFTKAKADGKGPRRSILFMTVTGEEKGLLGSDYYAKNPIFPLANTVVNLNIDMVGRTDPAHEGKDPYVYVIGSDRLSSELHKISESINQEYTKLDFDYLYNAEDHPDRIYYRSDHWNFAKNDIPIIFYFDGIHADYHKVSDEVDKIEFDNLQKRAQVVFYTAWELANRDKRIETDLKK